MTEQYFSSNIDEVDTVEDKLIHLKIESLSELQLKSLENEAQKFQSNKQITISFKKSSVSIAKNQINLFTDIILKNTQFESLHIKNRYSNGSQQNVLSILQQTDKERIQKLLLDFKKNDLNQEEAETLNQEISSLVNLQELQLIISWHTCSSFYLDSLKNLRKCSKLHKLTISLEKTPIGSADLEKLIKQVSEIEQLKSLKLKINGDQLNISDSHILKIIPSKLLNLEELSIMVDRSTIQNTLTKGDMELEEEQIQNSNLKKLVLHENFDEDLQECQTQSLQFGFNLLNSYPNLRKLNLNLHNLTESDYMQYYQSISKQNQLEDLQISFKNNQQNEKLAQEFQNSLSHLKLLKKLNLSVDLVQDFTHFYLPKILQNCVQIFDLQLQVVSFNFDENSQKQLFDILPNLANLQNLKLLFPADVQKTLPLSFTKSISKCLNLQNLELNLKGGDAINKQKIKIRLTDPGNQYKVYRYKDFRSFFNHLQTVLFKQRITKSLHFFKAPKLVSYQIL
ncbi:hypothetical protein TTHERM_00813050 (macronuclear) [Tetrahymena thermophila SB210]|uniref:Kinase domain protein n=1 Tax=Tetrahymena thermophila (strain SB210) TaxID=312017 RepID=Q22SS6_TETTS|nr:hypothetical protein TTHERM_00813050 [Tetrahymena thermophila SB210]EAR88388.1 hypothetical protein TTHERM_00813050 [Tetrahymena thermophila SB210]|eukprot:XP_001008633.1 hypothetical protein TTHERM_00813050 [Tetrahymena thermophila SB210]